MGAIPELMKLLSRYSDMLDSVQGAARSSGEFNEFGNIGFGKERLPLQPGTGGAVPDPSGANLDTLQRWLQQSTPSDPVFDLHSHPSLTLPIPSMNDLTVPYDYGNPTGHAMAVTRPGYGTSLSLMKEKDPYKFADAYDMINNDMLRNGAPRQSDADYATLIKLRNEGLMDFGFDQPGAAMKSLVDKYGYRYGGYVS